MKQLLTTILLLCAGSFSVQSQTAGSGGGVYLHKGRVEGSLITNNRATTEGTGVYVDTGTVTSSTVVNNLQVAVPAMPAWVQIPGGTFTMGCTSSDNYDCPSPSIEIPTHSVTLSGFYMSESEVTNAQYCAFLNAAEVPKAGTYDVPGFESQIIIFTDAWGVMHNDTSWVPQSGYADYPVINVNWYGAYAYCQYYGFRLPTEAEWEYAARGGTNDKDYSGSDYNTDAGLETVGWYTANSGNTTHAVKGKLANRYGLYDMSGNVWEWCNDRYAAYTADAVTNPTGPAMGTDRVLRGGGWSISARGCRVSCRNYINPDYRYYNIGFRVCL